jgi:glycosyltransferase involved in cell wall biosynthesis
MNTEEILKNVDKIKISVVMQVNLKDYPNSRNDASKKFIRAVESFKNQIYKNCELIIVSDGCHKAHQQYNRSWANEKNIRFIFADRTDNPLMYEDMGEGKKYFRGFARGLGVAAASGTIITYLDSDDYLLPEFTMTQMLIYNSAPEKDWWINTSWYDHTNVDKSTQNLQAIEDSKDVKAIKLDNLPGSWKKMQTKENRIIMSPWLFTHKATCTTKWRDVISEFTSEDVDFHNRLRTEYTKGTSYSRPIYARCHYKNLWDV